jgi:hypothetical protein
MSHRSEDFAHIANAEKQLCDEAGPLLAAIIRAVEAKAGLAITEVRVTLDRTDNSNGVPTANCTIIRADSRLPSPGRDIQRTTAATEASSGGLSLNDG